ncbi:hypothetical protein EJK55_1014 [Moraxella catarrhalis]|uniref:Uncharacterized protein n=1 Tax=Moraxella catarrhalis TaxID=480 RepID=A0ABY0BMK1_MORCA|nr:hypothetical protein MCR_0910 [Moraxella catarrhalis BBH18]AZQ87620.1 hypothetical protein EJK52_0953 [Moraxella catarrhalis]EKF83532.1 hypothetical protein MCRH_0989 [Moraxella catarrhalis RH4]AZQ88851.1 hypothetical protein EJK50_1009 [Moraxella catarrhalis]AZQ90725.1 hypothetical protein EJK51_0951 [Moraxella catarrhalis]
MFCFIAISFIKKTGHNNSIFYLLIDWYFSIYELEGITQ